MLPRRYNSDTPKALDALVSESAKARFHESQGRLTGADNLLAKALIALDNGDADRAEALVRRACGLPYDDQMATLPGPWAAHMLLHSQVMDALEECQDDDDEDEEWLDAALDLLPRLTGLPHEHLKDMLNHLVTTWTDVEVTDSEHARIVRATGAAQRDLVRGFGLAEDASVDEQFAVAWPFVEAALRYHRAFTHGEDINDN